MAQWGNKDETGDSPLWTPAQRKQEVSEANRDALYGNTEVGVFAVDALEQAAGADVAHTGWVLRTVGTGGRAGRVQTEVLVAGGIVNDAEVADALSTEDDTYPDA